MLKTLTILLAAGPTVFAQFLPGKGAPAQPTNTNVVYYAPTGVGTVAYALEKILGNRVYAEMWGAKGDGTTIDTSPIQSGLTYATANGKTFVFTEGKTYKMNAAVSGDCNIDGRGATLDFGNDFNGTAVTLGPSTGTSLKRRIIMPSVVTGRTTPSGWSATNGIGIQFQNLGSSEVFLDQVWGFAEGVRVTTMSANGAIYNSFHGGHFQSDKVAIHLKSANGGWVNSNRFYDGRVQYSGGITNGQAGSYSIWIEAEPSGHDANQNEFFGYGTEGDINQYAIFIQGGEYNNFWGIRLEQTTPTMRCEGVTGNDAVRNKIILGYATNGIVINNGTLGYDNWIWTPDHLAIESGGNDAGIQMANRTSATSRLITLYSDTDKYITGKPAGSTLWETGIAAGATTYKNRTDTLARVYIDAVNGRINFGDGTTALGTNYFKVLGANTGIQVNGGWFQVPNTTGNSFRLNAGVANGSVATTLGSVGPTGATAGNPQGWMIVNVNGTDRFVPYWRQNPVFTGTQQGMEGFGITPELAQRMKLKRVVGQ